MDPTWHTIGARLQSMQSRAPYVLLNLPTRQRIDVDKLLKNQSIREAYQVAISNRFECLKDMSDNIDEVLETINENIREVAKEVIGFKRKKTHPWISDEVLDIVDERRAIKARMSTDPSLRPKYSKLTHDIQAGLQKCQADWTNKQCLELETANRKNDLRTLFGKVKEIAGGVRLKVRNSNVKDEDGKLLTNENQIKKRLFEYCKRLYNQDVSIERSAIDELWLTSQQEEIEQDLLEEAISKLKPRKAPGIDGIEGVLIRNGGETMVKIMHKICNKIWQTGEFPKLWTQSLIIVIPKKGDTTKCENNRTISLICHASKIILEIIRSRMKPRIEQQMAEEQAGFRPSRGTIEQIFSLRLIAEKYNELQHGELYWIFIDFKKAFDRVCHEAMWRILYHYGMQPKLIKLLEDLYKRTQSAVIGGHDITDLKNLVVSPDVI